MISLNKIQFNYRGQKPLFQNLNLTLQGGQITGLVGRNGEGKSSLLKIMCGLLTNSEGTISINGYEPKEGKVAFLEDLFFVPEEFEFLTIMLTPASFAKSYKVFYPNFSDEEYKRLCQEFNLSLNKRIGKQSMGEKKKMVLAFALATNCKVIIMDEPFNAIDLPSKEVLRKTLIAKIDSEKNFIISSHQIREMENLIDSICLLHHNEIVLNKTMESVAKRVRMVNGEEELVDSKNIIYSKETPYGKCIVTENRCDEETNIDLEMLFFATTEATEKIVNLFKH